MYLITRLCCVTVLAISILGCQPQNELYISLDGETLSSDNAKVSENPYLQITKTEPSKGIVLFLPESGSENDSIISVFNQLGYSVATLSGNNIKISDAVKAYRLIKSNKDLKLNTANTCLVGYSEGAKLAAFTENKLAENERPDDLILINPVGLDETVQGTVFPAINPPFTTKTKLLSIADTLTLDKKALNASLEYFKTWIGYDGEAFFKKITDAKNLVPGNKELMEVLISFMKRELALSKEGENPSAVPVEGYAKQRHTEKTALVQQRKYDLLFVGNSITNNFDKPEYQAVWKKYFGSRNGLNLGYSGYRTENIIWNIQNGELEGQSPKVIILEIGTNNIDEKNYPTRHTAGQLAGGIEEIVKIFREKCPDSKIILLRCFPGCYGGPNPTSHRRILERASDIVSHLADNKHIFYCDVNHVFLNTDGSIKQEVMPDWLHPNPKGAELWAQAMEPLLSKLIEDESHDDHKPHNTALIPTPKLEDDVYNWWDRHNAILKVKDTLNPEIVLIGNSITHFWGGDCPPLINTDGSPRKPNGPESWKATFGDHRVLNLGYGWDRIQNVLWRLDNGELDGLDPKLIVMHIGTNNTSETNNARRNTPAEIVEGIEAICVRVRSKVPRAKIVLMQIMPREEKPDSPLRIYINEINKVLKKFAEENDITLLDITNEMLTSDGILTKEVTYDFCHPTDEGYKIWGEALRPYIENIEN
ncbi:MAG: hypothetical protein CMO01_21390 [Thalassobius sp.]|nr:hypothetical protein [Thalassovita sp.]